MKPIRFERPRNFVQRPWDERLQEGEQRETAHAITDQGAVHSEHATILTSCSCGHVAPVAGFCAECSLAGADGSACASCVASCARCRKLLCPRHSIRATAPGQTPCFLCGSCAAGARRGRLTRSVLRILLSPFVEFKPDARR